jgi:hypothetical protein
MGHRLVITCESKVIRLGRDDYATSRYMMFHRRPHDWQPRTALFRLRVNAEKLTLSASCPSRPAGPAALLAAADKAGKWNRWHADAIPHADQLYEICLKKGRKRRPGDDQLRHMASRRLHRARRRRGGAPRTRSALPLPVAFDAKEDAKEAVHAAVPAHRVEALPPPVIPDREPDAAARGAGHHPVIRGMPTTRQPDHLRDHRLGILGWHPL